VAVRGGNGRAGEIVGRCANGRGVPAKTQAGDLGFRCCAGPRNEVEVSIKVREGSRLERLDSVEAAITQEVVAALPPQARAEIGQVDQFEVLRRWRWRPVAGDELILLAGCSRSTVPARCGLIATRRTLERLQVLGWAETGYVLPGVYPDRDLRDLWLMGEDAAGSFQRLFRYSYGRIEVGARESRTRQRAR